MRPRFIVLNSVLFFLAFLVSKAFIYFFPLDSMGRVTAFIVHGLVVLGVSVGLFYAIFGKKVLLLEPRMSRETMLDEARYILVIAGTIQVLFPLIPSDGTTLYHEFAIGIVLLLVYFWKHYWSTFLTLLLFAAYLLVQNYLALGLLLATPYLVGVLYELVFLYKMVRLNLQKAG